MKARAVWGLERPVLEGCSRGIQQQEIIEVGGYRGTGSGEASAGRRAIRGYNSRSIEVGGYGDTGVGEACAGGNALGGYSSRRL